MLDFIAKRSQMQMAVYTSVKVHLIGCGISIFGRGLNPDYLQFIVTPLRTFHAMTGPIVWKIRKVVYTFDQLGLCPRLADIIFIFVTVYACYRGLHANIVLISHHD